MAPQKLGTCTRQPRRLSQAMMRPGVVPKAGMYKKAVVFGGRRRSGLLIARSGAEMSSGSDEEVEGEVEGAATQEEKIQVEAGSGKGTLESVTSSTTGSISPSSDRKKYLQELSKEPYAVAVLGLVALSKGVEAVSLAAKELFGDRLGEGDGNFKNFLTDKEFWEGVGESLKEAGASLNLDDTKLSRESFRKSMGEWSRNLEDAYDWASDEVKEDVSEAVSSLREWGRLQGGTITGIQEDLKTKKAEGGPWWTRSASREAVAKKKKEDESAFTDVWNAFSAWSEENKKVRARAREEALKRKEEKKKLKEEQEAEEASIAAEEAAKKTVQKDKEGGVEDKSAEEEKSRFSLPFLQRKKQEEVVEEVAAVVKEEKALTPEDLVKSSVGFPKIPTSTPEPLPKEPEEPVTPSTPKLEATKQQDKSVAAMVDRVIAETKNSTPSPPPPSPSPPPTPPSASSQERVSQDIENAKVPTMPPTPVEAAPSSSPPTVEKAASVPATASTPPKPAIDDGDDKEEVRKPIISYSGREKTGPGTASFFKTAGKKPTIEGAMGGGSAGVDPTDTTDQKKGLLGEDLGRSKGQIARSKLDDGDGGASNGSSGDGSGGGGSGDGDGQPGDPSPGSFPFLWIALILALGAIAYKIYKDRSEDGPSDGDIQWSSTR